MHESSFKNADGLNIFTRSCMPKGTPRAVIVLVHGFNAHSGYMIWAAEQFAARGLAAYALDLRGRGRSDGERFFINSFSEYTGDVDQLVAIAKAAHPGLPVYVLGHSAGGVVASTYVFEHQDTLAGLVCESFALDVGVPDAAALLIKGISHLAPHLHIFTLKNEIFSRDPAVVAAMNADPLIANESQPAETSAELIKAAERLKSNMPKYRVPILIIHGTADKATRYQGSEYFYEHAGSTDKTLKLYEGHYHDLLNDVGREEVLGDVVQWMEARVGRAGS